MNKDLKKLIVETINDTFAKAKEKLVERGVREIYYDICPHCKTEIHEKHDYTRDGGVTWRHSDCGGLIARPETPLEEVVDWLRPYAEEAREQRREARKALGMEDLIPGVPDRNTTDGLKQLGTGGMPQGGPAENRKYQLGLAELPSKKSDGIMTSNTTGLPENKRKRNV